MTWELLPARLRRAEDAEPPVDIRSCARLDDIPPEQWPFAEFALRGDLEASIDWFALLQRQVFADDPGVRHYALVEDGQARAVLPLRRVRRRGVRVLESLSNYYTSLYSPLLGRDCDPLALRHLLGAAARQDGGAHVMRLAPMDPESPAHAALLSGLRATGWVPLSYFCFGNWFLKVEGGWEDYLRRRSANLRSTIKRKSKQFADAGGALELIGDAAGLDAGVAAFQAVYSASWKKPEPYPAFVPALIRLLAGAGMLRLGIARLNGEPVAAQLWIVGQGKASIYKVAYHEAFASYSPGTVLTSFLMRHVIEEDRVGEVDFLIGDDKYKQIWMSHRRERRGIIAFNTRTVIGCLLLGKEAAGRLAKKTGRGLAAAASAAWRGLGFARHRPPSPPSPPSR